MMIAFETIKLFELTIIREVTNDRRKRREGYYNITYRNIELSESEEKKMKKIEEDLKKELILPIEDINEYYLGHFKIDRIHSSHGKYQPIGANINVLKETVIRFYNQSENKNLILFVNTMIKKIESSLGSYPFKANKELLEKERFHMKK